MQHRGLYIYPSPIIARNDYRREDVSFGDICGLTECYSKQSCLFSCDLYSTDNLILIILSHLFPLRSIGSSCCDIAAPEIHLRYNICLCARRFVFANLSYSLL